MFMRQLRRFNPRRLVWSLFLFYLPLFPVRAGHYRNFEVALYARVYEVRQMKDLHWLEPRWDALTKQVKIDKVYLETHRDRIVADAETVTRLRRFFEGKGVGTAGGIATVVAERNGYQTFCYTTPADRQKLQEIVEHTARLFDEIILDDFFFTSCKCESCIQAKGSRSWTQFRLELMDEAARELVIKPAKAVNPKVKLVIKYPNWYEHFQGLGYDLEVEPKLFDGIYTGTETRDPILTQQHLQPYQGYLIFRYLENVRPGGNGGGWVDTGALPYLDRYAEQLWLTLFAKAPEITLFDFRQMQRPIRQADRAAWHGQQTSLDFDRMIAPFQPTNGTIAPEVTFARVAGYTFERADRFLGKLGKPVGAKSYKPFHSTGEDFLHNYLGMVGIALDLVPEFPADAKTIFLAESAKSDGAIVDKIKRQLRDGKTVVITSGLLRALQGKGIEDIVELRYSDRKAVVRDFMLWRDRVYQSKTEIVIPQIEYLTNDSWEDISCLAGHTGYPFLHRAGYAKGFLYVLTIPDNFSDLYLLPAEVLTRIKDVLMRDLFVRVESPSQVSLFVYDNDTFIVESFLPEKCDVRVATAGRFNRLRDLLSDELLSGRPRDNKTVFDLSIAPHSYRVFSAEAKP